MNVFISDVTKRFLPACALLMLSVAATQVFAAPDVTTLGELLDKGATKVGRDEWRAMLPLTIFGSWEDGRGKGESRLTYKSDGTFFGNARYLDGLSSNSFGTWTFDAAGRACIDEQLPKWGANFVECRFIFKLGADLFRSASDSDRGAPVAKRVVEK